MREMKDSGIEWIGEIPVEWNLVKTKRFFTNTKKIVGTEADKYDRLALTLNGVIKRSKDDSEGLQPEKFEGYQILCKNELVFKLIDLENVKTSRVGLSPYTGLVSPTYIVLSNNFEDNRFFYYWFIFMYYNKVFNHLGGEGVRSALNSKDVLSLLVPDIRFDEQCRIADYLDRKCNQIDAIIARQQEVIEKLKAYKLSVITEAVTKGLNPDVPMKDSGVEWIGEIPDFWNVVPLKTCADILPGYAFSSDDFDIENGTALLRGINVTPNGIRWEEVVYWNKPITEQLRAFELVAGDIVVGLDRPWVSGGTRVCWVTQKDLPALLLQRVCRIRAKENIDSRWIHHWIASKSFEEALSIETTGVSVPHISTKQIGQFNITLPPIEVQHRICDTLEVKCSSVDMMVEKKQAIIDKLTNYKKSLIYEVVTGKQEV